jgi:hypothetical protein
MSDPEPAAPPVLHIVRGGEPTDEELTALVTVLSARAAAADADEPRSLRQPLSAWVASGMVKGTRTKA